MDSATSEAFHCRRKWTDFLFQARVPILYYHRVAENIAPKYGVSPKMFESQMEYLRRGKYSIVSFEDLENHISFGHPLPPRPFIISFDDGYADTFTRAFPILKRFGFTATVFLVSGYIGKNAEWDGCKKGELLPLMTRENIHEMLTDGFQFGSHTRTHKKLIDLSEEAAREEIEKSKQDLENLIQRPVRSFSYPYGDFNKKIIEMVKMAGYGTARTVVQGNIHFEEDLIQLRCIKVNGFTPKWKFAYYLSRIYHLEQIWQERRKQKKGSIEKTYSCQAEKEGTIF